MAFFLSARLWHGRQSISIYISYFHAIILSIHIGTNGGQEGTFTPDAYGARERRSLQTAKAGNTEDG